MKIFKLSLATLLVVLIAASVLLYKGDLSTEYVDNKYSNAASAFLTMENGARVHYKPGHCFSARFQCVSSYLGTLG